MKSHETVLWPGRAFDRRWEAREARYTCTDNNDGTQTYILTLRDAWK